MVDSSPGIALEPLVLWHLLKDFEEGDAALQTSILMISMWDEATRIRTGPRLSAFFRAIGNLGLHRPS